MNDSSSLAEKGHVSSNAKMRIIGGRKWEYPIQRSKVYWKKFCDDAEKNLVRVRDPSDSSHYFLRVNPFKLANVKIPINRNVPNKNDSEDKTFRAKAIENSPLKIPAIKSISFSNPNPRTFTKTNSHPMSQPLSATSKNTNDERNVDRAGKRGRAPSLNIVSSQPSFGRILSEDVDSTPGSSRSRSEPSTMRKSLTMGSLALPTVIKNKCPVTSSLRSTPKKSVDQIFTPQSLSKGSRTHGTERYAKNVNNGTRSGEIAGGNNIPEDLRSVKYSTRCAYKALERLTRNKRFNFDRRDETKESRAESRDSRRASLDEIRETLCRIKRNGGESLRARDVQKHGRKLIPKNLRSTSAVSMTIPSVSPRLTSGSSLDFVYPEPWHSPSTDVLAAIPRILVFPRKSRDRCLPCMYKSFRARLPGKEKISLPRAVSRRFVGARDEARLAAAYDTTSESDSSYAAPLVSKFGREETGKIPNYEIPTKDVRFHRGTNYSKTTSETRSKSCKVEREKAVKLKDADLESLEPDSSFPLETTGAVNLIATSLSFVASTDRSKVSLSSDEGSCEESDSLAVSINEDRSKFKYLAPCHAPTNFRPSLEPLRALRLKRPTTLRARIASNEISATKGNGSYDEHSDDARHQPTAKSILPKNEIASSEKRAFDVGGRSGGKEEEGGGGGGGGGGGSGDEQTHPRSVALKRSESARMSEKMIAEKVELSRETERRRALERGSSFPTCLATRTPRDTAAIDATLDASILRRDGSTEAKLKLQKSNSIRDDIPPLVLPATRLLPSRPLRHLRELPFTRTREILELSENLGRNATTTDTLDSLCREFSIRFSQHPANKDRNIGKNNLAVTRLTKLLADSKRYLRPDKFPSDLLFSTNQPPLRSPRRLKEILPLDSYNLVAPLLGIPKWYLRKEVSTESIDMKRQRIGKRRRRSDNDITFDLLVHPPTSKDSASKGDEKQLGQHKFNPYALFLRKPRREAVTWRPLAERDLKGYDPDATLKMRTDGTMRKICQDFCHWIDSLGGTDKTIDEEVLRDMFEIDFKAEACRAMQISIREMPMVPTEVALTRNSLGASKLAMTKKHLIRDAKAERKSRKVRAFGSAIPWELQFLPPKNQVEKIWLQCENVPVELETMETVWKDIQHLESVRGFVNWLRDHPEVQPPEALRIIVSMDIDGHRCFGAHRGQCSTTQSFASDNTLRFGST